MSPTTPSRRDKPTDEELDIFERERQMRRMPGYSRIMARRNAELFKASVQRAKRKARKK
jgi:hypothetical protein